jgi:hypothetical protein
LDITRFPCANPLAIATRYAAGSNPAGAVKAERALEDAIRSTPDHPDLYLRGAAFLMENGAVPGAPALLDKAAAVLPHDRDILLRRALTPELARRFDDSARQLEDIETHWPEWYPGWLARGMILNSHGGFEEARIPAAYYYPERQRVASGRA